MTPAYRRPAPPSCDILCKDCGRSLKNVEIGLTKKMINRGAKEYLCLTCLAAFTGLSEEELLRKAEHFKKMGCVLF